MKTRSTLHVPEAVEHAAHETVRTAAAVGHTVVDAVRHEADVLVDVVLSPLAVDLDGFDVEITEEDVV